MNVSLLVSNVSSPARARRSTQLNPFDRWSSFVRPSDVTMYDKGAGDMPHAGTVSMTFCSFNEKYSRRIPSRSSLIHGCPTRYSPQFVPVPPLGQLNSAHVLSTSTICLSS
ncbi:hypothetical protein AC1031_001338 [Aphanomyces cochlioides]|nr:hypothetical protein AC1031_001338 [Aphanomyces cochlioides]